MSLAETRSHVPLVNKKKEKKAKKAIRVRSKKMSGLMKQYMKLRAKYLNENPYCEWWLLENIREDLAASQQYAIKNSGLFWIGGKAQTCPLATEIHHRKGRGKFLLDELSFLAVSCEAHRKIHASPKESYEKGYMLPRR